MSVNVNRGDAGVMIGMGAIGLSMFSTLLPPLHQVDQADRKELRIGEGLGAALLIGGSLALSSLIHSDAPVAIGIGVAVVMVVVYEWAYDRRTGNEA